MVLLHCVAIAQPPSDRKWIKLDSHSDEFDTTTIDSQKWHIRGSDPSGPEKWKAGWLYANNVSQSNGCLVLTSRIQDDRSTNAWVQARRRSEMLCGQDFGYWEASMKLGVQPGQWPAFWLMPMNIHGADHSGRDGTEIDIMEAFSFNGPNVVQQTIHFDGYGPDHQQFAGALPIVGNVENQFRTYGLHRTPEKYTWYVDGKKTWEIDDPTMISQVSQYVIFSTESAGFAGDIRTAQLPTQTSVDWLRVYKDDGPSDKLPALAPERSDELLANPGFEEGFSGWTKNGDGDAVIVSGDAQSGKNFCRRSKRAAFWHGVTQDILPSLQRHTAGNYEVSIWVRVPDFGMKDQFTKAFVNFAYIQKDGTKRDDAMERRIRTGEWTRIHTLFHLETPPEELTAATISVKTQLIQGGANYKRLEEYNDFEVDSFSLKKYTIR